MVKLMVLLLLGGMWGASGKGAESGKEDDGKGMAEKLYGEAVGYVDARVTYTTDAGVFPAPGFFTIIIDYGGRKKTIKSAVADIDAENKFEIRDKNGAMRGKGHCYMSDDVFRLEIDRDYYLSDLRPFRICKLRFTDSSMHRIKMTKVFLGDDLLLMSGFISQYSTNFMLNWESLTDKGESHLTYCLRDNETRYSYPCTE